MSPTSRTALRALARYVAAALAVAAATPGVASNVIDVDQAILERLGASGRLPQIYQQAAKRAMPPGIAVQRIVFTGQVNPGADIRVSAPPQVLPSALDVVDTQYVCNELPEPVRQKVELGGKSTVMNAVSNMDMVRTMAQVELSLSIPLPGIGEVGGGKITKARTETKAETRLTMTAEEKNWSHSGEVTVPPRSAARVQLVVTQDRIRPVPFQADFVVSGPVTLDFAGGSAEFKWERIIGNVVPPDLVRVPQNDPKFPSPGICRAGGIVGKLYGTTCYYNFATNAVIGYIGAHVSGDGVEVLRGSSESFRVARRYDPAWDAGGGAKICITSAGPARIPGYILNGKCAFELNGNGIVHDDFDVVAPPVPTALTATVPIEQWLDGNQRRFALKGMFEGVRQRQGQAYFTPAVLERDCANKPLLQSAGRPQAAGARPGVRVLPAAGREPFLPGQPISPPLTPVPGRRG